MKRTYKQVVMHYIHLYSDYLNFGTGFKPAIITLQINLLERIINDNRYS